MNSAFSLDRSGNGCRFDGLLDNMGIASMKISMHQCYEPYQDLKGLKFRILKRTCTVCPYSTYDKSNFNRHLRLHSGDRPYICSVCGFSRLQVRNESAATKGLLPPQAATTFASGYAEGNDINHFMKSSGRWKEGNFVCDVCGYATTRRDHFKRHLIVHTGERPFFCEVCFKGFNQKENLRTHLRIHTGERPFECPICHRRFSQNILNQNSAEWEMHLQNPSFLSPRKTGFHLAGQPHGCNFCHKSFRRKDHLKIHMRIHTVCTYRTFLPVMRSRRKFSEKQLETIVLKRKKNPISPVFMISCLSVLCLGIFVCSFTLNKSSKKSFQNVSLLSKVLIGLNLLNYYNLITDIF
ncbi:zinc finger protein 45-like [Uloborus diversus]|uniref:zinc finger protein 45-like n=1 Tax=Uloborus diversus TaxID=327109 RepID=UPI00240A48BE|nr:zinc finger protein 45-like [Uloborus diversus]